MASVVTLRYRASSHAKPVTLKQFHYVLDLELTSSCRLGVHVNAKGNSLMLLHTLPLFVTNW